ncbi:hypothetical protein K438DRAFT_1782711 [Mycena galopus ATCC 62051]|nr:hypothetical protein K438DRAFT_1782711 [Mycena galopus ATCC 62051]
MHSTSTVRWKFCLHNAKGNNNNILHFDEFNATANISLNQGKNGLIADGPRLFAVPIEDITHAGISVRFRVKSFNGWEAGTSFSSRMDGNPSFDVRFPYRGNSKSKKNSFSRYIHLSLQCFHIPPSSTPTPTCLTSIHPMCILEWVALCMKQFKVENVPFARANTENNQSGFQPSKEQTR